MKCDICKQETNGLKGLSIHLKKKHKLDDNELKKYYDDFLIKTDERKCCFCDNESKFIGFTKGYHKICDSKVCLGKTRATGTYEFLMYKYDLCETEAKEMQKERAVDRGQKIKKSFDKLYEKDENFHKKRSHNTKEYWLDKGFCEEDSIKKSKEVMDMIHTKTWDKRRSYPELYDNVNTTQLKYWLDKGFNEIEAEKKLKIRQTTFSLKICVEKHGEEKGKEIWLNRQLKWHKNYKKSNFSKISQKLFWEVYNKLTIDEKTHIKFATIKNGLIDDSGANNEERLKLDLVILPDFIDLKSKKIIEYDGVYYHRKNPENKKRERLRDETLIKNNYEVLHISEKDYKQNPEKVVKECIEFLQL